MSRETTISMHEEEQAAYTQSSGSGPKQSANPHSHRPIIRRIKTMVQQNQELQNSLQTLGQWDFNSFQILNHTRYPLFQLGAYAFSTMGLNQEFNINTGTLANFLKAVDQSYLKSNFYHNSLHAADVTASMIFLLHSGLERCGNLQNIEVLSLVVASLCHDVNHPGLNNAYLTLTKDKLALKFNDSSVLENMHANLTFRILNKESQNIIKHLSQQDYRTFRKYVITLILSTDLQKHFQKLKLFQTGIQQNLTFENQEFKLLSMQIAIKCADIGHGARCLNLHQKWSGLITKQFFRQGEMEKQKGIPISPLMNSSEVVICKSQIGFINFMVKPIFEIFVQFVRNNNELQEEKLDIEDCIKNITENLQFWVDESERYDKGTPTFFLDDEPPLLEFN